MTNFAIDIFDIFQLQLWLIIIIIILIKKWLNKLRVFVFLRVFVWTIEDHRLFQIKNISFLTNNKFEGFKVNCFKMNCATNILKINKLIIFFYRFLFIYSSIYIRFVIIVSLFVCIEFISKH